MLFRSAVVNGITYFYSAADASWTRSVTTWTATATTESTSYTTGAFVVQGGVGIYANANINGNLTVAKETYNRGNIFLYSPTPSTDPNAVPTTSFVTMMTLVMGF